jgi:putative ABC transport system permease protein
MDRLRADLRFALRLLTRRPGFTAIVVLVTALGIGSSTAVFTVVDHILFRPLDLPESERIVTVCQTQPQGAQFCGASPPNSIDWERRSRTFAALGIGRVEAMALRTDRGATRINVGMATAGFLRSLGISPLLGRLIAEDDLPPRGPAHVLVLSYELWQNDFGGNPDILGQTITLDEESFTVVGVLPAGLRMPRFDFARAWRPLPFDPTNEDNRGWPGFRALGRLTPTVTVAQAEADLADVHRGIVEEHPDLLTGTSVAVYRMRDHLVASARPMLLVFFGAVIVVLLIVSVNVASLLLTQATARDREFVVRSALGATTGTLARQLLIESALLAAIGGLAGAFVSFWATDLFLWLAPAGIPRLDEVRVDARVLGFAVAATGFVAAIFGLAPLARLRGLAVAARLREGHGLAAGRPTQRVRRALVVVQLALALMLLVGGGLLFRSFSALLAWEPGFPTAGVLTFQVFPNSGRYRDNDAVLALYRQLEADLTAVPGVRAVGMTSAGPLFGGGDGTTAFNVEGEPQLPIDQAPTVAWYDVSPDYFSTLGVPLRAGRALTEADGRGAPTVALVNEAFARRYSPSGSPVGTRISLLAFNHSLEIVGVVADIQPFDPAQVPEPEIYFSNRQMTRWATYFVLRTDVDPTTLAASAAATLAAIDPELVPSRTATLEDLASRARVGPRFNLALIGLFALVALVLGAVGTYGVMAYTVALRTREIGIRMALGAEGRQVLRWIGAEGLTLIASGLVVGLVAALAFSRFLSGMLHGVAPTDPVAYGSMIALLAAAGIVACLVPAIRASRIDPTVAIREE